MEVLIASNDQFIATRLRTALTKLGIECPHSQVLSHDSARTVLATRRDAPSRLVFFGSEQLSADDLSLLDVLCSDRDEGIKVVVVGTSFSTGAILQAVRLGAIDCLSLNDNLEGELKHLLGRLTSFSSERAKPGQLFTVISPVGGAGASVLAANLAAVIAQRQQQCCLLDLHWRGGDLATLLNSTPRHTLLSLAGKIEHLDRTMLDQTLVKHPCGIHLLASPEPHSDIRQIRPELIQRIVQLARSAYSTVVADLEDCEHLDQVRTLAVSDQIVVVLRPDFVSLVRAKKLVSYLQAAGVGRERLTLVANRIGQPKELPTFQAEEVLGISIQHKLPDSPAAVNEAINLGMPMVVSCPQSKATATVIRLAESLLGYPAEPPPTNWVNKKLAPLKSMACLLGMVSP